MALDPCDIQTCMLSLLSVQCLLFIECLALADMQMDIWSSTSTDTLCSSMLMFSSRRQRCCVLTACGHCNTKHIVAE